MRTKLVLSVLLFSALQGTAFAKIMETTISPDEFRSRCEASGGVYADNGGTKECTLPGTPPTRIACVPIGGGVMTCSWYRKNPVVKGFLPATRG